ncbi:MAG: DUF2815 family protein [Coriobacteriales bacterium]|jgi:hypothetical protein|nr:DUF2815 family protein [Coriobacteriales bacterium]
MANGKAGTVTNQTTKVVTEEVRLSFVHLFEPFAFDDTQEAKYSVMALIPKTDRKTLGRIKAAQQAAVELGVRNKWNGRRPAKLGNTLRDGDEEMEGEEFEGCYFIRASSRTRPGVVDAALNTILDSTEVYSGCYGRVSLNFFPYAHAGNNGISAGLNNVQKTRDGEPLGGRSRAEDDFDRYDTGEDGLSGADADLLGL